MLISELKNDLPSIKPIKEIMSLYIEGINPNIPNRNGFIYALIGSPGSGKSSLLLSGASIVCTAYPHFISYLYFVFI